MTDNATIATIATTRAALVETLRRNGLESDQIANVSYTPRAIGCASRSTR